MAFAQGVALVLEFQMMLAAGAAPDALFRGIAISRGIVVPAAA
jgi:hypothetical protein